MKLFTTLALMAIATFGAHAANQRVIVVAEPYSAISLDKAADVTYVPTPGAEFTSCTVKGSDRLINNIKVEVSGGVLHVSLGDGSFNKEELESIVITGAPVYSFSTAGAADLTVKGSLDGRTIKVSATQASDVEFTGVVKCKTLVVSAAGSADVDFKNLCVTDLANITLTGSSDFNAVLSGNATLQANVSGASDIDIKGSIKGGSVTLSGASDADLEKLNSKHDVEIVSTGQSEVKLGSLKYKMTDDGTTKIK